MNLYSLIETCRANGVKPYAYLRTLFARLPHAHTADDYEALLPWATSATAHVVHTNATSEPQK
jgi:transposase